MCGKSITKEENYMIYKAIRYTKALILDFLEYFTSIPKHVRGMTQAITIFIHDQRIKFQNILETNIELGKHHLFRGKISDALFRFKIAHFLFDPQNKEINYWLGWCYFFKSKYDIAIPYLEDSKEEDRYGLCDFIKHHDTAKEVPERLWNIIQSISIAEYDDRYYIKDLYGHYTDLPLEFVQFCLENIKEIPDGTDIMDYGCGTGLVGSMLDQIVSSEYKISAVENVEIFVDYVGKIMGDRGRVYDHVFNSSLHNIQNMFASKKHNIIFSFDSMAFTKELDAHFKAFNKGLHKSGHVALLLPLASKTEASKTRWSKANKSFVYAENDVVEQLKLAGFDILAIKKWKLGGNKSFIGLVATPNSK